MEITFWGVRGSYPVSRKDSLLFGGNTSCIYINTSNNTHIIIDGGTGIRKLGDHLLTTQPAVGSNIYNLLLSHSHWDHILGLPFFGPLYHKNSIINVYGATMEYATLKNIFMGLHDTVYFPVALDDLPSQIEFYKIDPGDEFQIADARIKTMQLNHPSVDLGYRVAADGKVITVLTDTARIDEVVLGDGMVKEGKEKEEFIEKYKRDLITLCKDSDILVYDAHFTEENIAGKEFWGHSTPRDAIDIAIAADVKELILFHHDPDDNDINTWIKERNARMYLRSLPKHNLSLTAAYEGLHIRL